MRRHIYISVYNASGGVKLHAKIPNLQFVFVFCNDFQCSLCLLLSL